MKYQLKRLQYSKIYRVNERTIRRWQEKEYPLDEPDKLLQVLTEQKNRPASLAGVSAGDLLQHWHAEADPKEMREAVRLELAIRVEDAVLLLYQARNLARERWKAWPEFTSRINAILEHVNALQPLIGVDDDDDIDRESRPQFLAAEGFFYRWGDDPEGHKAQGKRLVWADTASGENADPAPANIIPLPASAPASGGDFAPLARQS